MQIATFSLALLALAVAFDALPRAAGATHISKTAHAIANPAAWEVAGTVKVYGINTSDFDRYTRNPDSSTRLFLRDNYWRLVAFAPYFDSRLDWFPNAWMQANLYGIPRTSQLAKEHPEWILRDRSGRRLYIPWGCDGKACPLYAGDFGNPGFRRHWLRETARRLDAGYIGLWLNDANMFPRSSDANAWQVTPYDPRTRGPMSATTWRRYMAEFTETIRARFPNLEIVHSVIWFATSVDDVDPFVRRQIRAADFVQLERGINDRGLTPGRGRFGLESFFHYVDTVHALGRKVMFRDAGENDGEWEYGLAGHLLVSEGQDLYHMAGVTPDNWWTGLDVNLEQSLGPRYEWRGLLRRDFECGIVLLNQPRREPITVDLDTDYARLDGSTTRRVSLDAARAAILTEAC